MQNIVNSNIREGQVKVFPFLLGWIIILSMPEVEEDVVSCIIGDPF